MLIELNIIVIALIYKSLSEFYAFIGILNFENLLFKNYNLLNYGLNIHKRNIKSLYRI
jgi:hypothetical protein